MNELICYKTMNEWDFHTLPEAFKQKHNTQAGTWAKLTILSGSLQYDALNEDGEVLASTVFDCESDIPFVEPQAWHKVTPLSEDLRCRLSFYCLAQDFYQKKYSLTATHSEVLDLMNYVQTGKALDLGCGRGRNALFLQQKGFDVQALDFNERSIEFLQQVIDAEKLQHIQAAVANLHELTLSADYDVMISTVVMMFLDADKIPNLIKTMQNHTNKGGYHLIVSAMDSQDYPLSAHEHELAFGNGFKEGELRAYYDDWEIIKYNENVGHLHRLDAQGNRIALRFATLIARK